MSDFPSRLRRFNNELHKEHPGFLKHVNRFFDAIGLTEQVSLDAPSRSYRTKSIRDIIWGMVEFDSDALWLLDSPLVQRLRRVTQLGLTPLTYPTAAHSRFEHSIGVFATVGQLIDEISKNNDKYKEGSYNGKTTELIAQSPNKDEILLIKRASLLHDVGHGPYSHISEKLFSDEQDTDKSPLTLGGVRVSDLLDLFREVYGLDGGETSLEKADILTSGNKKLSEIIAAILLTSERFKKYYDSHCKTKANLNGYHDLDNISCLILGDPIVNTDLALPSLLHGAVDADKIDYMLRDATMCGINISIDKTRVILGAGIYLIDRKQDPLKTRNAPVEGKCKVFVIDKFGGDTYEQIGLSRQSLYTRVYHHPLTRVAEMEFADHIISCRRNDKRFCEALDFWAMNEDEIALCGLASSDEQLFASSLSFCQRSLPKRALSVNADAVSGNSSVSRSGSLAPQFRAASRNSRRFFIGETLIESLEDEQAGDLITRVSQEFMSALSESGLVKQQGELTVKILGRAPTSESILPETRLIDRENNKVIKSEFKLPSYLEAGLIPRNVLQVLTKSDEPELSAIAGSTFCMRLFLESTQIMLDGQRASRERDDEPFLLDVPIFDWKAQQSFCKISEQKTINCLSELHRQNPSAPEFWLQLPVQVTEALSNIAIKFSEFNGGNSWRVTEASARAFVRQFPVGLREEVVNVLSEDFELVGRDRITQELARVINDLRVDPDIQRIFMAPLTPTSGHTALSYLKASSFSRPDGPEFFLKNSVIDALHHCEANTAILLFDDHSASGTQASKQLLSYIGNNDGTERNIFQTKLPGLLSRALREQPLYLAFAYLGNDGESQIRRTCSEMEFNLMDVVGGTALAETSLDSKLTQGLKEFLRTVGTGLMLNKALPCYTGVKAENWSKELMTARQNALGYANFAGSLVTALNVPSSTLTAFWRPGLYDPKDEYEGPMDAKVPWCPLFIRGTQYNRAIIF